MTRVLVILSLISFSISAQQYHPDMNKMPDMKNMMQAMKKMQQCMQKIDPAEIRKMEEKSRVFEKEVKSLCRKGKRSEADQKASQFAKKMLEYPIAQKLKKCSSLMMEMPGEIRDEDIHICDSPTSYSHM